MASFNENIRKIRGEAIYGRDMREAIAQGLEQLPTELDASIRSFNARLQEASDYINARTFDVVVNKYRGTMYNITLTTR